MTQTILIVTDSHRFRPTSWIANDWSDACDRDRNGGNRIEYTASELLECWGDEADVPTAALAIAKEHGVVVEVAWDKTGSTIEYFAPTAAPTWETIARETVNEGDRGAILFGSADELRDYLALPLNDPRHNDLTIRRLAAQGGVDLGWIAASDPLVVAWVGKPEGIDDDA